MVLTVTVIGSCAAAIAAQGVWVRDGVREGVRPSGWRSGGIREGAGLTGWVCDGVRVVTPVEAAAVWDTSGFVFPEVSGVSLRLDAGDRGSLTLTDGGAVAEWRNTATPGDLVAPAYADAKPAWVFAGGRTWVRWSPEAKPLLQAGEGGVLIGYLFVVLWPEIMANNPYANMCVANGATDYSFRLVDFQDRSPPSFTVAVNYGDFGYSGYGGFVHRDGIAAPDGSAVEVTGPLVMSFYLGETGIDVYQLSYEGLGRIYVGKIGEVVGFPSLPSEGDANAVLAYLGEKWGVAVTAMEFPDAPSRAQVTVYFDGQGGFTPEGEESKVVTVGEVYGTLPSPSYEGYSFGGWYSYDLGGTVDEWSTVTLENDHTVYAVWY